MDTRLTISHRLGWALLTACLIVPALAHLGAQEAMVDCTAARSNGIAPVGCFALVPTSPYKDAGTGGTPLGASPELLSRVLECAIGGDSVSSACRDWEASRVPDAVMCIE